jgi:hypothetical protein
MKRILWHGLLLLFGITIAQQAYASPVEFIKLSAYERGKTINLIWETALEINNNYFLVQRSTDGSNFKVIGQVQGNATIFENTHYEFEDKDPVEGLSYYRIQQVDFNGSFSFSEVIEVTNYMKVEAQKLNIFPNPSPPSDPSIMIGESSDKTHYTLSIHSISGQLLSTMIIDSPGLHRLAPLCGHLNEGLYFVKVLGSNGTVQWIQLQLQV